MWGLERGYSLMIGGEKSRLPRGLNLIFKTIAPGAGSAEPTPRRTRDGTDGPDGYLHCGPSGAGHFVKMVHNGVEYGMMPRSPRGSASSSTPTPARSTRRVDAETTPLRIPRRISTRSTCG